MDLGTIKSRVESSHYRNLSSFVHDVQLVFTNALQYNPEGHKVYKKTMVNCVCARALMLTMPLVCCK